MSKIAVIADGSVYISNQQKKQFDNLFIVDVPILFGDEVRMDNATYGEDNIKFFQELKESSVLPTTSQPTPGDMQKAIDEAKSKGFEQAILIMLSSGISGGYQTAVTVANQAQGIEVIPWDSKMTVMPERNQALLAAEMAQKGNSLQEILDALERLRNSQKVVFVVDDISHLQRTGRLSGGTALVAGLLNIKPILSFNDEAKIDAIGKEIRMKRAWSFMKDKLQKDRENTDYPLRISIMDANNPELAEQFANEIQSIYPDSVVERGVIGPLIVVHTGEKAVAMSWAQDYKTLEK